MTVSHAEKWAREQACCCPMRSLREDKWLEARVLPETSTTVLRAFEQARRLSEHEASALLTLTLDRFQSVCSILNNSKSDIGEAMFLAALKLFYKKVLDHSTMSLVSRIVHHMHLTNDLTALHSGNDSLDVVLRLLESTDEWSERAGFEEAKTKYVSVLDAAVTRALHDWNSDLRHYKSLLGSAEQALKLAEDSRDEHQWSGNTLAQRIKPLISQLVVEAVDIDKPTWYIPKASVTWEASSFAEGSYGTVHDGVWAKSIQVVVKRLKQKVGQDVFVKEVDLWSQLKHPYIIMLWGANHITDDPFMVCEKANHKQTLASYLKHNIEGERFWRLLYEMGLGIQYLHGKNIVHGDLKLDNILMANDGSARVADFGLSRTKVSSMAYFTRPSYGIQSAGALQ